MSSPVETVRERFEALGQDGDHHGCYGSLFELKRLKEEAPFPWMEAADVEKCPEQDRRFLDYLSVSVS